MERDLKFRAWHNGHKHAPAEMIYDEKPGDCLIWKSQGQNIAAIMQYTGLSDCDGEAIYEDDIVKHLLHEELYFRVVWKDKGWHLQSNEGDEWTEWSEHLTQIIGNVYESDGLITI